MFKVGDKVLLTPERIYEFRNNPVYGVLPGQIYTINAINSATYGQNIQHGFPWRTVGGNIDEGGSNEKDLILYQKAKQIDSWSLK